MEGVGEQNTGVGTGNRWKINRVLKCITLNAQSLKNKMVELRALVDEKKPHIISVTESWGKDSVSDGMFSLRGYRMYTDDRTVKTGGGTILYISEKLEQGICRPMSTQDFESSSWCWINEKRGKKYLSGASTGACPVRMKIMHCC